MESDILLPFFPSSGVLLPNGTAALAATDATTGQLLADCAADDRPLGVVHVGDDGLADVGCAARVTGREEHDGIDLYIVRGLAEFDVGGVVTFEGDRQRVRQGGREVVFALDEPLTSPHEYVQGATRDVGERARPDVESEVRELLAAWAGPEHEAVIAAAFESGLGGRLSYWVADHVLPDDTEEGTRLRLDLLRKRSETKRMRVVRHLLAAGPSTEIR